jgi:UDP-N-acetylmuramate dehydrogenase
MDIEKVYLDIKNKFPKLEIYQNHPLAQYTTIKIGGPADIFINAKSSEELLDILKYIKETESKITILGNGSNVLISDTGIRGIVIKNSSQNIQLLGKIDKYENANLKRIDAQRTENDPSKYLDFSSLDYDESDSPIVKVKLDSGVPLTLAITELIKKGITGLQWFAYIPGTIGGAVCCNIHGGKYHFSDFIDSIDIFNLVNGQITTLKKDDLVWDYDYSYFLSNTNLTILSVTLKLFLGNVKRAKFTVEEWIKQKSQVQPMNSLGSVFKNPPFEVCKPIFGEQKSAGWIIDTQLKWKGKSIGDAQISPQHANFIINNGQATAKDYSELVKLVQLEIENLFHFKLETEIKLLGDF